MLWVGVFSFLLFAVDDLNDSVFHSRILKACYPVGFLMLVLSSVCLCISSGAVYHIAVRFLSGCIGFVSLVALLYSLFGQFSLAEAYGNPGQKRPTCTVGMYALCRHPGVLWFIVLYICVHFCFGLSWQAVIVFSVLNILLALLEDHFVFPRLLESYDSYKKATPFLVPRFQSIAACLRYYI